MCFIKKGKYFLKQKSFKKKSFGWQYAPSPAFISGSYLPKAALIENFETANRYSDTHFNG